MDDKHKEIFLYQLVYYLIHEYKYQQIKIKQDQDDIWLINPKQHVYPVIRIVHQSNEEITKQTMYIRNVHRKILDIIQREGIVLILNTSEQSGAMDTPYMKQISVTQKGVSNVDIHKTFKGIDHVVHEVANYDQEYQLLQKRIEAAQHKNTKAVIKRATWHIMPLATYSIITACVLVSLFAFVLRLWIPDWAQSLIAAGAYYKMNIVATHEYWRLLTAGFIQMDIITLLLQMCFVYCLGKFSEMYFEKWKYLGIVLASIVVGNIFMFIADGNVVACGIGGGISGMYGMFIMTLLQGRALKSQFVYIIALLGGLFLLFSMLLPGISIMAYFGGFITGCMLTFVFTKTTKSIVLKRHTMIAGAMLLMGLAIWLSFHQEVEPLNEELDMQMVQVYQGTPMERYGHYLKDMYAKQYAKQGME